MDGLKSWYDKTAPDHIFANFKTHMRNEYLDLHEVGCLIVNNSMLNQADVVQELKEHYESITNNLKEEQETNFMRTLHVFNLTGDQ